MEVSDSIINHCHTNQSVEWVEKAYREMNVEDKKQVFRSDTATEMRMTEVTVRTRQMETKLFSAARYMSGSLISDSS